MLETDRKLSNVTPKLKLVGSPVLTRRNTGKMEPFVSSESSSKLPVNDVDNALLDELPAFERHEESTAIELFYDLFFVANLTTFSNIHEISTVKELTSYIGFFCILWFTWCLTSLYDVRFVSDSLLARLAKGAHLGVMVGLAISGPKFDTTTANPQLRVMALILMVSRLVLGCQYLLVLFHVRHYKRTKLPLGLIGGSEIVAGFIYMGISFAFKTSLHAYRAFYVVAAAEMVINIAVSSQWKVVSFKGTHLIERMSLLTLYILGEGVIDVLKSVATISGNQDNWSAANIGTLFGAISAIYLFYMLYFDTLNRHHFGTLREQIWSFLHFPFHVALVLCLAGMAQFVIWQKISEGFNFLVASLDSWVQDFANIDSNSPAVVVQEIIGNATNTIEQVFAQYQPTDSTSTNTTILELLATLENEFTAYVSDPQSADANATLDQIQSTTSDLVAAVLNSIMSTYGFGGSEFASDDSPNPSIPDTDLSTANITAIAGVYTGNATVVSDTVEGTTNAGLDTATLIFQYFFIATGFTIILMGVMGVINVRNHTKGSWFRFVTHLVFGAALCLMTLLSIGDGQDAYNLAQTAWPLPIVAIVLFIVLAVHHVSWKDKEAAETTGEKKYHFLPRWRPSRHNVESEGV